MDFLLVQFDFTMSLFFISKKIGKLVKHFIHFPLLKKPDNASLEQNESILASDKIKGREND